MGIFNQLRKRVKNKQMDIPQPVGRGGGFFGGLPFAKEKMSIGDMRFRDPRFEPKGKRKGLAGLFGRMPRKLSEQLLEDQVAFQPDMLPVQNMRPQSFGTKYMPDFNMQGRMMMADGDVANIEDYEASTQSLIDFLNSDPEQVSFGRAVAGMLAYDDGVVQISEQEVRDAIEEYKRMNRELVEAMNIPDSEIRQEVLPKLRNSKEVRLMEGGRYSPSENPNRPEMIEGSGRTISDIDRQGRTISDIDRQMIKGYAEGDEVSMMMMELEGDQGMSKSDMEGLEDLAEISGPETEMLNNIINQIIELIAQGATEEEVIAFLRQQGLDEEDISAVMSMLSQQLTAGEESIDSQLAALG